MASDTTQTKEFKMASRKPLIYAQPSSKIKSYFLEPQWAQDLFSDPSLKAFNFVGRVNPFRSTEESFCTRTLATDDTIPGWQFFHRPVASNGPVETVAVLKLGSGVNGHIDTCHGGFLSVVLDEVIGTVAEYEKPEDKSTMTAFLKVDYKKPIRTPGTILCRAWLDKREGRKLWARGTIEDGQGTVMATGEALFIITEKVKPVQKL